MTKQLSQSTLNNLRHLTDSEKFEVLDALTLSTPHILNHLIDAHEKAIATNQRADLPSNAKVIEFWSRLLVDLKALRSKHFPDGPIFTS